MAEPRRYYNGAAAYDVYTYRNSNTAQPLRQPQRLPEERPLPQRQTRVKVRTEVAPFTMLGLVTVACLLVLVIFGYVQLFEASTRVSRLESQLQQLQSEQTLLQSKYEGRINLEQIAQRAEQIGLKASTKEQIVYVNLCGSDRAEIYQEERNSVITDIIDALQQSVSSLIAYLHPTAA